MLRPDPMISLLKRMEQGKFTLPRSILFSLAFKLCQMLRPDPNSETDVILRY